MSTDLHLPPQEEHAPPPPSIDYAAAEGFAPSREETEREWTAVAVGLTALLAVLAIFVAIATLVITSDDEPAPAPAAAPAADKAPAADAPAPTLAESKGIAFEQFEKVDPTLPAPVTKVDVDVFQHVTQVSKELAPTEVWSFAVNGEYHRGTGVSPPIVVEEGTKVHFSLTNGSDKAMKVDLPHSLDFHSAEVNPGTRYRDLAPGKKLSYTFVAKHPGVFMYHCATQPVLMHTGAGMVGMMIVKPKNLPPVDKELWMTQQEFYVGKPGQDADMAKMSAKKPDVIAFNGFANQYQDNPITVKRGEKVRMYVLNAGPSIWSAFHVIGTVFDRTVIEGQVGRHAQTVNLAPSQGGWVEFTLDEEGTYPFVTHGFGDMVKGALGVLATPNAPKAAGHGGAPAEHGSEAAAGKADANVTLGDMWVKSDVPSVKAGKVTFSVKNEGATMHGLAIAKTPVKAEGGMLDHEQFLFHGKDLAGGESETITADLEPGTYELVCHVAGHYMAGQKLAFTVS
jgi:nitrite reductase (NO-forming)